MRLYLDTEFNGFGGELISLALVSEDGREWYEVLPVPRIPHPWVQEHVIPKIGKLPIEGWEFRESLCAFLRQFDGAEIIADWPADFEHLCNHMTGIGAELGCRLAIECRMTLLRGSPDISPEDPHNALSDARALRDWHIGLTK